MQRSHRRVGLRDTFAEGSRTGPYLFGEYGLSIQAIVDAGRQGRLSLQQFAHYPDLEETFQKLGERVSG